ncbi:MAG: hypothetical protein ABEL76_13695, partial [Bradymonadaceae bacterium]
MVDTEPSVIDAKFEEWIKKRAYANYVEASQHSGDFPRVETRNRFVRALETSRQGHLLAYKTVDRQTGQHRLFVVDERDVKSETRVVTDGRPGYESLHPLDEANFDVGSNAAVFAARSRGRDVIYWHELDRQVEYVSKKSEETSKKKGEKRRSKGGGGGNGAQADEGSERTVESVEIHKRRRRAFHIAE